MSFHFCCKQIPPKWPPPGVWYTHFLHRSRFFLHITHSLTSRLQWLNNKKPCSGGHVFSGATGTTTLTNTHICSFVRVKAETGDPPSAPLPPAPPVRELAYGNSFILEATTTSSTSLQHVTAAVCQCCLAAFVSGRLHSLTFSLETLFLYLFVFVIDIDFVIFFLSIFLLVDKWQQKPLASFRGRELHCRRWWIYFYHWQQWKLLSVCLSPVWQTN